MNEIFSKNPENISTNVEMPIPELQSVAGWKEIPIVETQKSREPLVPIGLFSDHRGILASSVYDGEHQDSPYDGGLEGSLAALFVREGVAKKLEVATSHLPRGYHLMAMDTYRSLTVQGALYKQYEMPLRAKHPDWTDDEIATETQKYVSKPSTDPSRPSPHNTGAAVDVVLVRLPEAIQAKLEKLDRELAKTPEDDWQKQYDLEMDRDLLVREHIVMMSFGTAFDHGGPEAALRYYEVLQTERPLTEGEIEARDNRRLLYHVMVQAGFMPYEDEWWHFNDPASQMGAKVAGKDTAEYGAIGLSDENVDFAQMRWLHRENTRRLAMGVQWKPPEGLETHYNLARRKANITSLIRHIGKDAVSKISPIKNQMY